MNPFEKIFNYQILSRLEDSDTFVVTSHERAWLRLMLEHPAATEAFHPDTLRKLDSILEKDPTVDVSEHIIEKAKSLEQPIYHPLLRQLRRLILNKFGMRISYALKDGRTHSDISGVPYKLEYSMVKREWYLLWFEHRHQAFMSTRLKKIVAVNEEFIDPAAIDRAFEKIRKKIESKKTESVVEVAQGYNKELSRILYAFSCFDKKVDYDERSDRYTIRISLFGDELEYLLSKIRFLGKRVRVVKGGYLKRRMLEAATKALERYGEIISE